MKTKFYLLLILLTAISFQQQSVEETKSYDINFLPQEIGKLKKLRRLNISNNNLTLLPPEIGKLKKLEILNVSNNKLTSIPPQVVKLKMCYDVGNMYGGYVTKFNLTDNPIEIPPIIIIQRGRMAVKKYFTKLKKKYE